MSRCLVRTTTAKRRPGGRPITASTWGLRGPGSSRWKSRTGSLAFRTGPSMPLSRARRSARRPWETEARAAPRPGSLDSARATIMYWSRSTRLTPEALEHYSTRLVACSGGRGYELLAHIDGMALTEIQDGKRVPVRKLHSGYTDRLTVTPPIRGGPERILAEPQQPCEPWFFVLLDESENYELPNPPDCWRNGNPGVQGNEAGRRRIRKFPAGQCTSDRSGVAGRQTHGPLAERDAPRALARHGCILRKIRSGALERLRVRQQRWVGRSPWLRCPIGAHMRRVNPRGQPVAGQGKARRQQQQSSSDPAGHAYGPAYEFRPSLWRRRRASHCGIFRQLLHENQYEFVLRQSCDDSAFFGKTRLAPKSKDPLIGANDPGDSVFDIPQTSGPPLRTTGFSSFVTTRAAAYCFLPSVAALQRIATLR